MSWFEARRGVRLDPGAIAVRDPIREPIRIAPPRRPGARIRVVGGHCT